MIQHDGQGGMFTKKLEQPLHLASAADGRPIDWNASIGRMSSIQTNDFTSLYQCH
ncbi:hypothetical protein RCCGEPOP_28274 [Rhizobium sp. Pop5]|nr:hypothetical protein RCCGEPOP_28274 [Rhizobium sp. Pop5]